MNVIRDNIDKLHSGGEKGDDTGGCSGGTDACRNPNYCGKESGCRTNESTYITKKCNSRETSVMENSKKFESTLCKEKPKKSEWLDAFTKQLEHLGKGTTWLAIILGQVLSALLCVSAFASVQLVETYNIRIPNAQNFAFYVVLASVFTSILACRPAERNLFPILRTRGWKYVFVALADAEANYLITKAYQFTTLTSVQLLDCFTIPTVLSLSWLVLRIRFKVPHILGVSISLLGVSCLVWADIEDGIPIGSVKERFMGDMLCLTGAFLMGVSNIVEEFVVKTFDGVEFLGMIGLFGCFFSGTQAILLEYEAVSNLDWSSRPNYISPMSLLIIYATAQLAFYVLATTVIKYSGATLFNLSLLSADFYSLIVSIYFLQVKFHALYFLSYVLVMTGVITFSIKPTMIASHVYKSLTREITTTLDLELMASTPSSVEYHHNHQNRGNNKYDHEKVRAGRPNSLLIPEKANTTNHHSCNNSTLMLSNDSCDVVLQTRQAVKIEKGSESSHPNSCKVSTGTATNTVPEEAC